MKQDETKRYWLDDPANITTLVRLVYVVCAVLLAKGAYLAYFTHAFDHAHYGFEKLFFFYGAFGFGSFVFLVMVAKLLRKVVRRDEHYYDPAEDRAEDGPGGEA